MAVLFFQNIRTLTGGYELTAVSQSATVTQSRALLDATTMNSSGWEESVAGLKSTKANVSGFYDPGTTDLAQFSAIGAAASDLMIMPTGGADAAPAFIAQAVRSTYNAGGKVGDLAPFDAEFTGTSLATQGTVLKNGTITSTSTGTIMLLGAISATQTATFQIQCTAISGTSTPTITMIVQSAAVVGFGSPTTRASFTALTAVGSQTINLAGAVTDTYWRVSYTVSGTNPSFTVAVAMGIEAN